jgi:hypothetical protein
MRKIEQESKTILYIKVEPIRERRLPGQVLKVQLKKVIEVSLKTLQKRRLHIRLLLIAKKLKLQ